MLKKFVENNVNLFCPFTKSWFCFCGLLE